MTERDIVIGALDRGDPAERAAYLNQACAGDTALRQRVEALLRSHETTPTVLKNTAAEQPGDVRQALTFLAPARKPGSLGRLDHYEVLAVVGKGGMGVVLKAFDEKLQRVVAVKLLAPHLSDSDNARQRFVREARVAAAVSHDHVIGIHAVEDAGPVPYLVMEFIDGLSLESHLQRHGPLPIEEVVRIGQQIALGLDAAHKRGVIHRDIKPANILLQRKCEIRNTKWEMRNANSEAAASDFGFRISDFEPKIVDFGLARAVDDTSLTWSGYVAGTPDYMSPEQADGRAVDHRSDLFSLGSVLYALCTGRSPFRADNVMAVMRRVSEAAPRPPRELNADVPAWLEAVIARLHAKDPADRYQTAGEVAEVLGRRLAQMQPPNPATLPQPEGATEAWIPVTLRRGRPRLRRTLLLLFIPLLIGVAVGAVIWLNRAKQHADDDQTAQGDPPAEPELGERGERGHKDKQDGKDSKSPPVGKDKQDKPNKPKDQQDKPKEEPVPAFPLPKPGEVPTPEELARHPVAADALRRQDIPEEVMDQAVRDAQGDLPELVAVLPPDKVEGKTEPPGQHLALAISPDGKTLAAAGSDRFVRLWDLATGKVRRALTDERVREGLCSMAYSPDGKVLATGHRKGTVHLWHPVDGKHLAALEEPGGKLFLIAFSPDGKYLAVGREKGETQVWEVRTTKLQTTVRLGLGTVYCVAFSPDSQMLAVGGQEQAICLWDVANKKGAGTMFGHKSPARCLAFDPDGRNIAVASEDKEVLLRHVPDRGRPRAMGLVGHESPVRTCLWRADGGLLITTALSDGAVRLWDPSATPLRGREIRIAKRGSAGPCLIALSPEGRHLAISHPNGAIYVMRLAVYRLP
jgi:serine/threonine protein kinase/WD40 repeat protein